MNDGWKRGKFRGVAAQWFLAFGAFWGVVLPSPSADAFQVTVCHVSSSLGEILPSAKDRDLRYSGFVLGVEEYQRRSPHLIRFKVYQDTRSRKNILNGVAWAKEQNCDVLIGIVSSRDALIAAPLIRDLGMVGVSSTATTNGLEEFFPAMMSASTSASSWVRAMVKHAEKEAFQSIVVMSQPGDIYSLFFRERLQKHWQDRAEYFSLSPESRLKQVDLARLDPKKKTAIISTVYPIRSIPSLSQIASLGLSPVSKKWKIFGTQSWMEAHVFRTRPDLIRSLPEMLLFSPWSLEKRNRISSYPEFVRAYQKRFQSVPNHDAAYDFDVMGMISSCLDRFETRPKIQALRKCLSRRYTYRGVTGNYPYDGIHPHPQRPEKLVPLAVVERLTR